MFPDLEREREGDCVYGADLGQPETKSGPKYINSPETPLYQKGQVLFNLDKAKSGYSTGGVCAAG